MKCPSCESMGILHDRIRGEQICTRCGLVVVERLPQPAEYRWEGVGDHATGAGAAEVDLTRHDFGLGSGFGVLRDIPPSERASLRRMRALHDRSRASRWSDRSLREALIQIDQLCEDLSLPKSVRAEISQLYRKSKAARLTTGYGTWQVSAALAFIVCRLRGLARTEDEVSGVLATRTGMGDKEAVRSLRRLSWSLARRLGLRLPNPSPGDYVDRFGSRLGFPKQAVERAHELCTKLPKRLRTKPAVLLAAAALYDAAREAGVSLTIRKTATELGVSVSGLCQTAALIREVS